MAEKTITIGGKEIRMKATALTPILYKRRFRSDMISDMMNVAKTMDESKLKAVEVIGSAQEEGKALSAADVSAAADMLTMMDLTIFLNACYIMAKQGDPEGVPEDPDEWLDSIDGVFSIWEVMPAVLDLWGLNNETMSTAKKNSGQRPGK